MRKVSEKTVVEDTFGIFGVFKSVGLAYVVTLFIFIVLAVILVYTEFPDTMVPAVVIIGTLISIMFAGTSTARRARTRGWLNGAASGFVYMAILYLISSLTVTGFGIDRYVVLMMAAGMAAGALGGIVGINLHKRR